MLEDVSNHAVQDLGIERVKCYKRRKAADVLLSLPNEVPPRDGRVPGRSAKELPGNGAGQRSCSRK
jgi:hypothetical protein